MARKKQQKKKGGRRRVGAAGGAMGLKKMAPMAIAGIAGAVASQLLANNVMPTLDNKIKGGILVAAGIMIPRFMKSPIGVGAGIGIAAVGGVTLLKGLGVVAGPMNYLPGATRRGIPQMVGAPGGGIPNMVGNRPGMNPRQGIAGVPFDSLTAAMLESV